MKKYNLELKEKFKGRRIYYSGMVKCGCVYDDWEWLYKQDLDEYYFTYTSDGKTISEFTEKEIDELPHGVIKMHDIIEVEEQLYYIRLPHLDSGIPYINLSVLTGRSLVGQREETPQFKTKFTENEIKEKYPLYANDNFMVKVEGVE